MTKSVQKIAAFALPIIGTFVAPGIGTSIGTALGATTAAGAAGLGGAALGAAGGLIGGGGIKGAATGAALGGIGGYVSGSGGLANAAQNIGLGTTAIGAAGPQAPSGLAGLISGAGNAVGGSGIFNNLGTLSTIANLASGINSSNAATDAAQIQAGSVNNAINATQQAQQESRQILQPYVESGTNALQPYSTLVNDPNAQAAYINANPFYKSLADDAEKRLLANQAAKGKVGSGGTAAALQNQLTLLGNQLVQQQVGNLQNQVTLGQNAASGVGSNIINSGNNVSDLLTQSGNALAAGKVGSSNAYTDATQSALASLLELQKLKNPSSNIIYR